jgi:hypothetical protein
VVVEAVGAVAVVVSAGMGMCTLEHESMFVGAMSAVVKVEGQERRRIAGSLQGRLELKVDPEYKQDV